MTWTLAGILLALPALGLVSSFTTGGFIPVLLVLALVVVALIRVIQGHGQPSGPAPPPAASSST